ncbi:Protein of unknown function [Draconibacterium orientale]|uniref:DUF2975 domain-containing protein n=1 Tax=Draconibacterium orientale TaxID=1168034 RepID=X5DNP3_9BACT|nr:DUF2975 domain-containing protein [Draconibacterium orientale]AHW62252.1 hypothetical protein FH5T_18380 [Draconibacterium orientale]SES63222.1 Protein of unknown function [Draconibacterium orientale]
MKKVEKTQTEHVLILMKVVAWIAFFSFVVAAGVLLFSYFSSVWNPESAKNIHEGLNLYQLRQENFNLYSVLMASQFVTSIIKAIVWWMVVKLITKIKLTNPFASEVAFKLERISYLLFAVWVFAVTTGGFIAWLGEKAGNLNDSWNHGQYLFMAGLVFIISQIFKRGVELQNENDLTV